MWAVVCTSELQQQQQQRAQGEFVQCSDGATETVKATGIPLAGWTEGAFFSEGPLGPLRQTSVCWLICPLFAKEMFT